MTQQTYWRHSNTVIIFAQQHSQLANSIDFNVSSQQIFLQVLVHFCHTSAEQGLLNCSIVWFSSAPGKYAVYVVVRNVFTQKCIQHQNILFISVQFAHDKYKGKERKSIYIAPFCTKVHTKRSGMDYTVLPANNTMPAFPL